MKVGDKVEILSYTYRFDFSDASRYLFVNKVKIGGKFPIGTIAEINATVSGYDVKVKFDTSTYYFTFKPDELKHIKY